MQVVLFQPQIPQNTGNIVRTCSVTGSSLLLVRPLGFSTSNRMLKRAGLDYWDEVTIDYTDDLIATLEESTEPFYFFSSHATQAYTEIPFSGNERLIFGSEDSGLPSALLDRWPKQVYTIPMVSDARCLNLSNAVSIVLYEGWRQLGFSAP